MVSDMRWLRGFSGRRKWTPERELSEDALKDEYRAVKTGRNANGVYALLWERGVRRCIGESRILYVGSSWSPNWTIPDRLWCLVDRKYRDKHVYDDLERFRELAKSRHMGSKTYYTCLVMPGNRAEAREREILMAYMKEHGELPPFNRQLPPCKRKHKS
jgi:hypothetical protein